MRETIDKIESTLILVAPFISSLLRKARIIATKKVPTAAVDSKHQILINPEFFNKLEFKDQTWILAHEVIHLAFNHVQRGKNKNIKIWNMCTDAVSNSLLSEMIRCSHKLYDTLVTYPVLERILCGLGVEIPRDFNKLGAEELYRLFPKELCDFGELKCPNCGSKNIVAEEVDYDNEEAKFRCDDCKHRWTGKITRGEGIPRNIPIEKIKGTPHITNDLIPEEINDGEVIQEGDEEIYDEADEEKRADKWRDEVFRSYSLQKTIGTVPAGLKRIIDKLFKPKVNWRTILRTALREGIGKTVAETWIKPSRKSPMLPGIKRFTMPTVYTLVDTSSSISDEELKQFISEIYAIAKNNCEIKNICWDAEAYEIVTARNKAEVITKIMEKIRGGGGTKIKYCLWKTLKTMKPMDIVIVMTDGEIWDIDDEETKELFRAVASRSSITIFATTNTEHKIPGWRTIKIEVDKQ